MPSCVSDTTTSIDAQSCKGHCWALNQNGYGNRRNHDGDGDGGGGDGDRGSPAVSGDDGGGSSSGGDL